MPNDVELSEAVRAELDRAQQERAARLPGADPRPVDPESFSGRVLAAQERKAAEVRAIGEAHSQRCASLRALHEAERVRQALIHADETAAAWDRVAALDKKIKELQGLIYEETIGRTADFAVATKYEPESWGDPPDLPPPPRPGSPYAGHGGYIDSIQGGG